MIKTKKTRKIRGGFLGLDNVSSNNDWINSISQNASNMWNNISSNASNLWEKTKQSINLNQSNNSQPTVMTSNITGGKKTKKLRGGYGSYINYKSSANNAAPFTQPTAKPQVMLGGKSKKHKKYKKSRKMRH